MNAEFEEFSLWQRALALGQDNTGFYEKKPYFALVYIRPPGADRLMVSFDDLSRLSNGTPKRDPWALKFALDQGWGFLGVMPYQLHWYRDQELMDRLEEIGQSDFFQPFEKVLFTGASMGAYGACAFAKICPGANVLAFSPQNTLDPKVQNYDRRYPHGIRQNWDGRFCSAREGILNANKAYLVYDPLVKPDKLHIEAMMGANAFALPMMGAGHRVALVCRNVGILKEVTTLAMEGTLNPQKFAELAHKKRAATLVRNNMVKKLKAHGHNDWALAYGKACFLAKQNYMKENAKKREGQK